MKLKNDKISKFELAWRFNDSKYNLLPVKDLRRIRPLNPKVSEKLWKEHVSTKYRHLLQIPALEQPEFKKFRIDWDDKDGGQQLIVRNIPISHEQEIIFFWSPTCSVKTDWKIFLKYWDDFCYPDDDSNVIVISSMKCLIQYCEEQFFVPKIKEFL